MNTGFFVKVVPVEIFHTLQTLIVLPKEKSQVTMWIQFQWSVLKNKVRYFFLQTKVFNIIKIKALSIKASNGLCSTSVNLWFE